MPLRRPSEDAGGRAPLGERLRRAVLKPTESGPDSATGSGSSAPGEPLSVEQLEVAVRVADDKERLVGLFAAPLAALIGILVIGALITNDPAAHLKNGQVNKLHVSLSLYQGLAAVLIGMSILMLVSAMLRKRLYLGILLALYGLAVFNLHYWGFGVPFILGGAWLLVRVFRLNRDLREASGEGPTGSGARASAPRPNRRYTAPKR